MIIIRKRYRKQKWGANWETFCDTSANENGSEVNYRDNRMNGDTYIVNGKTVSKTVFLAIKGYDDAMALANER